MSKIIRLEDDVYSALKGCALREGKTLSAAVYALMHTADCGDLIEKRFSSLESQIAELKSLLLLDESFSLHKIQNREPGKLREGVWQPNRWVAVNCFWAVQRDFHTTNC